MTHQDVQESLAGIWLLGLLMLILLAAVETSPSFGILNGCDTYPAECAARTVAMKKEGQ